MNRVFRELALSPGQLSVSGLLYQGLGAKQIAELQGVAPSTVIDHIRKIYSVLDVRSAMELRSHIDAKINRTWGDERLHRVTAQGESVASARPLWGGLRCPHDCLSPQVWCAIKPGVVRPRVVTG